MGPSGGIEVRVHGEDLGPHQVWALNIHGFGADGSAYAPESEWLASTFGWRVVTPTLPGLDSIQWTAARLELLLDELGIEHVLVLGHSMGAAVRTQLASRRPDRTLGLVVRAGCLSPAWSSYDPMRLAAGAVELADFTLAGRPFGWLGQFQRVVELWCDPEALSVARSLLTIDLRGELGELQAAGVPALGVWGSRDLLVPRRTSAEFARASGAEVVTVPGGHHWMILRPPVQAEVLVDEPAGERFLRNVNQRALELRRRAHEAAATSQPELDAAVAST